jgi:hypothetical protein
VLKLGSERGAEHLSACVIARLNPIRVERDIKDEALIDLRKAERGELRA